MKIRDATICYPNGFYVEYTICPCDVQGNKNTIVCNRIEIRNGGVFIYEVHRTPGRNRWIHGLPYIIDYEEGKHED